MTHVIILPTMQHHEDSCTTTEEMSYSSDEEQCGHVSCSDAEDIIRWTTERWLAIHGPKLFALEASKFNAQQLKKEKSFKK